MSEKIKYKDNQDFFDNSTNEEKIRIISNNIEERQIIPTRRGQFICDIKNWYKDKWPWYIFRAKIENIKGKVKWYQLWASTKIEDLIKIAYVKLANGWYLENNIYLPSNQPNDRPTNN